MPRAKARYDTNGSWKNRQSDGPQWDALTKRLQEKLKPYYPDKSAVVDPAWGHPADQWSNILLGEAEDAVTMMQWHSRRLTNEELRVEQRGLFEAVNTAVERITKMSHDLNILFGNGVDLLGPRDKLAELIPHIEATEAKIASQPKAQTPNQANHAAALEMAIRVLRPFKAAGGTIEATADKDLGYISDAVRILQILGNELGLTLDETTWKKVIIEAKNNAPDLR